MKIRRLMCRFLADRLPHRDDERGSLAMAMMAVLVGATLGALILPMVISQNKSTRFDITRVHSLSAAQAGIDVVVGRIRSSTKTVNGTVTGDPSTLPCGVTGSANDGGAYTVTVAYWRDSPSAGGSALKCRAGYGTYGTDSEGAPVSTPRYAVITSTGTDGTVDSGSRGRTVVTTYALQTDDTNIPGGLIRLYPPGPDTLPPGPATADKWCMDAGSAVPVSGRQLALARCSSSTPPLAQQVFAYRVDLSIQLVSSITTANPNGLCVDTPTTSHTGNPGVVLKTCAIVTPGKCPGATCSPYYQQWSVNDSAHFESAQASPLDTDGRCINASSQASTTLLNLTNCSTELKDTAQSWVPSPTVGAGMAGTGVGNDQLVNFRQFAKCLDIPVNGDTSLGYLSLFTCKQNPDPTKVAANQRFTPVPRPALTAGPTTVLLKTKAPYCLTSPQTTTDLANYVSATTCPGGVVTGSVHAWTIYQAKDAGGDDLPYAKKFTIVDGKGFCMGLGRDDDLRAGQYYKAVVKPCDGSTGQKWSASASLAGAQLGDTYECKQAVVGTAECAR